HGVDELVYLRSEIRLPARFGIRKNRLHHSQHCIPVFGGAQVSRHVEADRQQGFVERFRFEFPVLAQPHKPQSFHVAIRVSFWFLRKPVASRQQTFDLDGWRLFEATYDPTSELTLP